MGFRDPASWINRIKRSLNSEVTSYQTFIRTFLGVGIAAFIALPVLTIWLVTKSRPLQASPCDALLYDLMLMKIAFEDLVLGSLLWLFWNQTRQHLTQNYAWDVYVRAVIPFGRGWLRKVERSDQLKLTAQARRLYAVLALLAAGNTVLSLGFRGVAQGLEYEVQLAAQKYAMYKRHATLSHDESKSQRAPHRNSE